jgi:predicted amidohydrolase
VAERVVVACVQQRMHLPLTLDEYREDLRRFMRVAATKQARLVVFPELGGVMVAPPILGDFRSQLLKRSDRGRRRRAGLWDRLVGGLAGTLVGLTKADFRRGLAALLDIAAQDVWQSYEEVFGGLAREFGVTVVAPSAYLPDPVDGVIRNLAVVFNSNGQMVGRQAKVVLHPADTDLAQAGATWDVIATEVGQIGLILGSDVLYPEVGRLLAYQGADLLVIQAACTDQLLYQKLRAASLARMQDNQLFAAVSFLVGENQLSRVQRTPFVGKSALLAPQELTPRSNGVLVEMGNLRSEGVLAAEWNFAALRDLWETSETPVRQQLPLQQAGQVLAQLYARLQTLPKLAEPAQQSLVDGASHTAISKREIAPAQSLDELVIIASATQRWPPIVELPAEPINFTPVAELMEIDDEIFVTALDDFAHEEVPEDIHVDEMPKAFKDVGTDENHDSSGAGENGNGGEENEDETDEMDAVAGADRESS